MLVQPGVLATGTPEHCYLEFDLAAGAAADGLVRAVAGIADGLSSTEGVNVVVGVRPGLWAQVAPAEHVPAGVDDWLEAVVGPDGFTMPATPHDVWVWVSGGGRTEVFDVSREVIATLGGTAVVASEITGWHYRHDRDLTGFIDGTENPRALEAPDVVGRPEGAPGAGASVLLFQLWSHDSPRWEGVPTEIQEQVIGRTKDDSTELDESVMPPDSHVSRTVVEVDGEELPILRRNTAYGGVTEHGTVFVGFSHDQWRMAEMLRRMAGVGDGARDALTRYTTPTTGAYYVIPSVAALQALAPPRPDD